MSAFWHDMPKGCKAIIIITGVSIVLAGVFRFIQDRHMAAERAESLAERAQLEEIGKSVLSRVDICRRFGDSAPIVLKGRALIWDFAANGLSLLNADLGEELAARSTDTQITVFVLIDVHDYEVGQYSITGTPGYATSARMAVIYWPQRKPAGVTPWVTVNPPSMRPATRVSAERESIDRAVVGSIKELAKSQRWPN
jgi:hypothetical protein